MCYRQLKAEAQTFLSHGHQPEVYVLAVSTFLCPTTGFQSSHFSIFNLTFSPKREEYASKRRNFEFRLTSVAQKRLCLSSLTFALEEFHILSYSPKQ